MTGAYEEAEFNGKEIWRANAPFDEARQALNGKIERLVYISEITDGRLALPKNHSLNQDGSYTAHGISYVKGAQPLFVRDGILANDLELAKNATQANRDRKYFTTEGKDNYESSLAIAGEDKGKSPIERRVLILPSRNNFQMSMTENAETFEGVLGNSREKYLQHADRKNIMFYLVNPSTVDSQDGELLTQAWFRSRDSGSYVNGNYGDLRCGRVLHCGSRTRGIRSIRL